MFLAVTSARSAAQTGGGLEGRRISSIEFQPSPAPLAPQDLERVQPLKVGSPLRATEVAAAIDGLFATGRFEDIQVDAEPVGDGSVAIKFVTVHALFVGHVGVVGKTAVPPSAGQIVNTTQLNLGVPFHDKDLQDAQQGVKKLFESNGLYEATVNPKIDCDLRTQTLSFTFEVRPGKRAKYTFPGITGHPLLSEATILRATGWRVPLVHYWRQVTQSRTTAGVAGLQRRYQKMDRLTASIRIDSIDYQPAKRRVKPNLNIEAGPKVKVRAVEAKISNSRLRKYVPVYEEGAADRDLLVEGAKNLRDYFQSQGYYDSSVEFRPINHGPDEMIIEYVIARGPRYKLAHVEITGNRYFQSPDLRDRMFLEPASLQYRHGRFSEAFLKRDEEAITNLYKANGFRDVEVTSEITNPYKKDGQIGVTLTVKEGPQSFVESLSLQGITHLPPGVFEGRLTSATGQPFSDLNIATDRNTILTEYFLKGFPNASFEYQAVATENPQRVNLTYLINEGPQQFIREVIISGLTDTRRTVVDRQLQLKGGDPLSTVRITDAQRRLYNLGIFAKVDTAIQNPDGDERYKNVIYDFEEAHRYRMNIGFGAQIAQFGTTASTNSLGSPGGTTGFSPRGLFEISRLNLLGVGHTLSFRSAVSNLEQRASLDYLAPRFMNVEGRNITVSILYNNARDVRTFASKREEASVQVSQKLSKPTTLLVRYSYRRVSTSNVVIPALLVPQLLQPVGLGMLSANLVQDKRDDPTDAHRGIYNTIDAGIAANFFGSQRNFGRVLAQNATYHQIGKKYVFARRIQFGTILPYSPPKGLSAAESVPLPERFFGGGANTMRGFPFNQAGPRDLGTPAGAGAVATQPTGFPLGGNALLFNTLEFRFPLIGSNIGGVLFHDAGNVYSTLSDISFRSHQRNLQDFNYMVHAAGFGIRYRTPIGPLRIDLAYSINPPSYIGFNGTQRQLLLCNPNAPPVTTGPCASVKQNISHFQFSFSIGQAF